MKMLMLVCLGGAAGSGLRFGVDQAMLHIWPGPARAFPWATLAVNLAGCFLAGLLYGWLGREGVKYGPELKTLLIVGLCGGLTTFSAFALQTLQIAPGKAIANIAASVVGGLVLAWLGIVVSAPGASS